MAQIQVIAPKPFHVVGTKFDLFGKVSKSLLLSGIYGLSVDWMTSSGGYLPRSGPNSRVFKTLFPWTKNARFMSKVDLSEFEPKDYPRGLILSIETHDNANKLFLPVIVAGTREARESELEDLRIEMSETIKQTQKYEIDSVNYIKELTELRKSEFHNKEILQGMFKIVEQSDDQFPTITFFEEEKHEEELNEKYKELLNRRGPLLRGLSGVMDGFQMRVYSNDHGKHFHVIHKGKGVNARFSFPDLELLSHVSKTTIGEKTKKRVQKFCKEPEIFKNLEAEFAKRT